jgi:uncharacterized SAM-binding protein YcdF (DUF218 family)
MSNESLPGASAKPPMGTNTRRVRMGMVCCLVVAALVVFLVGRNLGRWLMVEDPLQKSDAILLLSGGMPECALQAARIYNQGYAPEVWLTHSVEPGATLHKYGVNYIGEDAYDRQLMMHEGVPESAIRQLEPPIVNTADEIRTAARAMAHTKERRIIIVSSKAHTRRAKTLWNRLASKDGTAIVRGASDDPFDAAHWWRNTTDALTVVREVLGLLNAWAGLPLQPST